MLYPIPLEESMRYRPMAHDCVVCGEEAYNPQDHDSGPWCEGFDGGVICSPACAVLDMIGRRSQAEKVRVALAELGPSDIARLPDLRVTYGGSWRGVAYGRIAAADGVYITVEYSGTTLRIPIALVGEVSAAGG